MLCNPSRGILTVDYANTPMIHTYNNKGSSDWIIKLNSILVQTEALDYQSFKRHFPLNNKDGDCRKSVTSISWSIVCQQGLFPDMLSLQVLLRTTVFARMTPDQKTQLVKELQKLKWVQTEKGKEVGIYWEQQRTEYKKNKPSLTCFPKTYWRCG